MEKYTDFKSALPDWVDENNFELYKMRHTAEHVLQLAVRELYPDAHRAMGPPIQEGFYFDFDPANLKITENDLPKIEKKMTEIVKRSLSVVREDVTVERAKELFASNPYKIELIEELSSKDANMTIYWFVDQNGVKIDFDLCKGPHVENTKQIGSFKLMSVAGAYWRGDEKNKMLTRIYGTTFATQEELEKHLWQKEEAAKRDHRKLGKEMGLFVFSDLVGGGLPLWTPKGTLLRTELDNFVWEMRKACGYQKVTIPHITRKDLYETSGHWAKYSDDLFKITTREGHEFAMKPMNCPHHTQIFGHTMRSYKDMPQRYAETTMVYRDEQSGELSGLSRVRCITQDDAHVFCRTNQLREEIDKIWDIIDKFYSTFGFDLRPRLSLHDPAKFENYLGTKEAWLENENYLREVAKSKGAKYFEAEGEAAFYGPKIDFMTKDSLGREWQVATIQLDTNMPERFDLYCINENSEKERIAMIHAAIMGSIERFGSVLIEHLAGKFPAWLAPTQVVVLPISDKQNEYADSLVKQLADINIRAHADTRSEKLQSKIRDAQMEKIPYMLIAGGREEEAKAISLRYRDQQQSTVMPFEDFVEKLKSTIASRKLEIEL